VSVSSHSAAAAAVRRGPGAGVHAGPVHARGNRPSARRAPGRRPDRARHPGRSQIGDTAADLTARISTLYGEGTPAARAMRRLRPGGRPRADAGRKPGPRGQAPGRPTLPIAHCGLTRTRDPSRTAPLLRSGRAELRGGSFRRRPLRGWGVVHDLSDRRVRGRAARTGTAAPRLLGGKRLVDELPHEHRSSAPFCPLAGVPVQPRIDLLPPVGPTRRRPPAVRGPKRAQTRYSAGSLSPRRRFGKPSARPHLVPPAVGRPQAPVKRPTPATPGARSLPRHGGGSRRMTHHEPPQALRRVAVLPAGRDADALCAYMARSDPNRRAPSTRGCRVCAKKALALVPRKPLGGRTGRGCGSSTRSACGGTDRRGPLPGFSREGSLAACSVRARVARALAWPWRRPCPGFGQPALHTADPQDILLCSCASAIYGVHGAECRCQTGS
jgi:hypothetical protein